MTKYLYGGQVYSIQKLIFSTNKMAEIIGASELLEKLTDVSFLKKHIPNFLEKNLFQNAAGHLRYSFENKENATKFLNSFRTIIGETFPSITYVDTLVEYQENDRKGGFQKVNNALRRLRNVPTKSMQKTILNGIRNTRTGNHTVGKSKKNEWLDAANLAKLNALKDDDASLLLSKLEYTRFENDLNRIPSPYTKSHIAVIHSDGNGMGRIINAYHESNPNSSGEEFRAFSESIKTATQEALNQTISCVYRLAIAEGRRLPFRPIIIGGDDITVACSADDALLFGSEFLKNFEATTRKYLAKHLPSKDLKNGLTACMGITFIKKNFPFHYAANLAEELCGEAKKASKKIDLHNPPSSLNFHKVQQAFFDDFEQIQQEELILKNGDTLYNGPYTIHETEGCTTIQTLKNSLRTIQQNNQDKQNPPDAPIRKYLTLLLTDPNLADIQWARVAELHEGFLEKIKLKQPFINGKTILSDLIVLNSMKVKTV